MQLRARNGLGQAAPGPGQQRPVTACPCLRSLSGPRLRWPVRSPGADSDSPVPEPWRQPGPLPHHCLVLRLLELLLPLAWQLGRSSWHDRVTHPHFMPLGGNWMTWPGGRWSPRRRPAPQIFPTPGPGLADDVCLATAVRCRPYDTHRATAHTRHAPWLGGWRAPHDSRVGARPLHAAARRPAVLPASRCGVLRACSEAGPEC